MHITSWSRPKTNPANKASAERPFRFGRLLPQTLLGSTMLGGFVSAGAHSLLAVTTLGLAAQPALAQCVPAEGSYACSGANATGQDINADEATVATAPGFSVDTTVSGGHALSIQGLGHISYTDGNAATLTAGSGQIGLNIYSNGDNGATQGAVTVVTGGAVSGGDTGISASNGGSGATSVTATGQVTGTSATGIYVENTTTAGDLTVNAAGVTGGNTGIIAANNGTGATSVTATGQVTGANGNGISVQNATTATGLAVNAAGVTGNGDGIYAYNEGTGATLVTATDQVTGTNGTGINAENAATATDLTVNAAGVTGGTAGIIAGNNGTGATSVTATGQVTGTNGNGIEAWNAFGATGLAVNAAGVTGSGDGIYAYNEGTGATSVTATGQVTGTNGTGINAENAATATDLRVKAAGVTGNVDGIRAVNYGTGATTITATGQVTGTSATGIYVENAATAGDLTVNAAAVTGGNTGIIAANNGTGATSVTATGLVTGTNGNGIWVRNGASATDLTASAAAVTGDIDGIYAYNDGTGATRVTATGQVTGTNGNGIWVQNATTAAHLTVSAAGVTGNADGIYAYNDGTGATSATATGQVTGTNGIGINAWNATTATDLTVNAARATGGDTGILAYNDGTGATSVTATGLVTGIAGNGIHAYNGVPANGLNVNAADVTAKLTGIYAWNQGAGATSVTATGQVTANSGFGIYASNDSAATTDLTVNAAGVAGRLFGIHTTNLGAGPTSITTSGLVEGGVSAISAGSGGQPITIVTNGLVRNTSRLSTRRLAIEAFGGAVALTNAGGIIGTVDFGVGANTMTNNAAWNTAGGENHFGGGTLTNNVNGTIIGGANAAAVSTLFDNLAVFVNRGVLTMVNGVAGDVISQTGGNARFEAGSVLAIDVNALGQADKFITTGSATLAGGTVALPDVGGVYLPGRQWTILNAAGGVSGTFAALPDDLPYVDVSLGYDASNVYLSAVRNGAAFCLGGFSGNECASANSIEPLGQGNTLYDLVVSQTSAQAAAHAFNQLSGEIHASAKGMLLEDSRFVRDAANDRIRSAFGQPSATAQPVLAYGEGGAELAAADTDRFAVWGNAFGAWGDTDSDGNAAAFDRSIGGLVIGGDVLVGDTWRAGLVTGFSRSSFDVDDRASSGDATSYYLGAYGGSQWGAVSLRTGAAYSWNSVETRRNVSFPGLSETLSADYDAGTAQIFGEAGYRIDTAAASFEPFANLAYVNVRTDAFTETGGAAALSQASSNTDATFTTLGIRASGDVALGTINATARGMIGWRHAFGDVTPLSTLAFAGSDAFTISGVPIARDAAVLEAGLDFDIAPKAKLGVSYTGQFGSGVADNGAKLDLSVRF